jgi:hypothetical protein
MILSCDLDRQTRWVAYFQAVCLMNSPLMLSSALATASISSEGIWRITSPDGTVDDLDDHLAGVVIHVEFEIAVDRFDKVANAFRRRLQLRAVG